VFTHRHDRHQTSISKAVIIIIIIIIIPGGGRSVGPGERDVSQLRDGPALVLHVRERVALLRANRIIE
jgi:hypothetical protein